MRLSQLMRILLRWRTSVCYNFSSSPLALRRNAAPPLENPVMVTLNPSPSLIIARAAFTQALSSKPRALASMQHPSAPPRMAVWGCSFSMLAHAAFVMLDVTFVTQNLLHCSNRRIQKWAAEKVGKRRGAVSSSHRIFAWRGGFSGDVPGSTLRAPRSIVVPGSTVRAPRAIVTGMSIHHVT